MQDAEAAADTQTDSTLLRLVSSFGRNNAYPDMRLHAKPLTPSFESFQSALSLFPKRTQVGSADLPHEMELGVVAARS